jgi:hypothetical protein
MPVQDLGGVCGHVVENPAFLQQCLLYLYSYNNPIIYCTSHNVEPKALQPNDHAADPEHDIFDVTIR